MKNKLLDKRISKVLNEILDKQFMMPLLKHMGEPLKKRWLKNISNDDFAPSEFLAWAANASKYSDGECPNLTDSEGLLLLKKYNSIYYKYSDDDYFEKEKEFNKVIFDYIKNNYMKYRKWLKSYHGNNLFTDEHRDQRLWNTNCVFSDVSIVNKQWIVHFRSQNMKVGDFLKGRDKSEMSQLAYTFNSHFDENPNNDGYMFGYLANDIKSIPNEVLVTNTKQGYGTYAIVFKGNGLRMYHPTDREYQIIFNAAQVNLKEACLLEIDAKGGYYWDEFDNMKMEKGTNCVIKVIQPYTREVIYASTSMEEILNWIETNYVQYRKKLSFNPLAIDKIKKEIQANPQNLQKILFGQMTKVEKSYNHATSGMKNRELYRMIQLFNKYKDVEDYNGKTLAKKYEEMFGNSFTTENLYRFFNYKMYDKLLDNNHNVIGMKYPEFAKYKRKNS